VEISLNGAGKKFYREWIFRNADLSFPPGNKTVIIGPNGSGKSTLLQVIAGSVLLTEGSLTYSSSGKIIDKDSVYREIAFASPYLELIEEFTLREIVSFHFRMRNALRGMPVDTILEITGLPDKALKIFKFFSSGMKQRIKLALALLTDAPAVLLDEPCSNLDGEGVKWYQQMIQEYAGDRIVVVASNEHHEEYFFCDSSIMMKDLKK
jgi:ABC-type multidrug transport system ATPase subunit